LAACLYIGGALLMEMLGSYITVLENQQNPIYAGMAIIEEIMEMMGIIVFMYGLLVYIREWHQKIDVEIKIMS
jgi:hypothetical protein